MTDQETESFLPPSCFSCNGSNSITCSAIIEQSPQEPQVIEMSTMKTNQGNQTPGNVLKLLSQKDSKLQKFYFLEMFPLAAQNYHAQSSVATPGHGVTPRHQVVAQLQQIHLLQQQQTLHLQQQPDYYNINHDQSSVQHRREVSRDSSKWSLTEGDVMETFTKLDDDSVSYANESIIQKHLQQKRNTNSAEIAEHFDNIRSDNYSQPQPRSSRHSKAIDDY